MKKYDWRAIGRAIFRVSDTQQTCIDLLNGGKGRVSPRLRGLRIG